MYEYCLHLVLVSPRTSVEVTKLEQFFSSIASSIHNNRARHSWFRKLFELEDLEIRQKRPEYELRIKVDSNSNFCKGTLWAALAAAKNTEIGENYGTAWRGTNL